MSEIPDLHPPSSRRRGIMLAQPFDSRRLAKWDGPWLVQPKLNGERCRVIVNDEGTALLLSSEEHVIHSMQHIACAIESLNIRNVELDGELYAHGLSFEEIHSRVSRRAEMHEDSEAIGLHIFDVVSDESQLARAKQLLAWKSTLEAIECLYVVPMHIAQSLDEIVEFSDRFIREGYEGVIVRHLSAPYERKRSLWVMKFKPSRSDIYEVVGTTEECSQYGEPKDRLGSLQLRARMGEEEFSCGTGLTVGQREAMWAIRDALIGKRVRVNYQHLTPGRGVPLFPVFVEILSSRG